MWGFGRNDADATLPPAPPSDERLDQPPRVDTDGADELQQEHAAMLGRRMLGALSGVSLDKGPGALATAVPAKSGPRSPPTSRGSRPASTTQDSSRSQDLLSALVPRGADEHSPGSVEGMEQRRSPQFGIGDPVAPPRSEALGPSIAPLLEAQLRPMMEQLEGSLKKQLLSTHAVLQDLRKEVVGVQALVKASQEVRKERAGVRPPRPAPSSHAAGYLCSLPDSPCSDRRSEWQRKLPNDSMPPLSEETGGANPEDPWTRNETRGLSPRETLPDESVSASMAFANANASMGSHFSVYHAETAHLEAHQGGLLSGTFTKHRWTAGMASIASVDIVQFTASFVLVATNAIYTGYQVERAVTNAVDGAADDNLGPYLQGQAVFSGLMLLEWALQWFRKGPAWFLADGALPWNAFDSLVLFSGVLEVALLAAGVHGARSLNFLRVLRLVKFARSIKRLRTLRRLFAMVGNATSSFCWAMLSLLFFVYVFAIFVTQRISRAADFVESQWTHSDEYESYAQWEKEAFYFFGSLRKTMFTLLAAVSGGMDWAGAASALMQLEFGYFVMCLYVVFVFGMVFCLSNILIALVVASTQDLGRFDREVVTENRIAEETEQCSRLQWAFGRIDESNSGYLSRGDLFIALRDRNISAYLHSLGVDASEVWGVFNFLDKECNGAVEVNSFVRKIIVMRGAAKNVDVVALIYAMRRSARITDEFQTAVGKRLDEIATAVKVHSRRSLSGSVAGPPKTGTTRQRSWVEGSPRSHSETPRSPIGGRGDAAAGGDTPPSPRSRGQADCLVLSA